MLALCIAAGAMTVLGAIIMLASPTFGAPRGIDTYIVGRGLLLAGLIILLGTFASTIITHTNT